MTQNIRIGTFAQGCNTLHSRLFPMNPQAIWGHGIPPRDGNKLPEKVDAQNAVFSCDFGDSDCAGPDSDVHEASSVSGCPMMPQSLDQTRCPRK